ncbi:1-phosphatidylinositol 3-phosphate 5-kinase-like isoform X2 [Mya arenaria]|uniref:1-phosphatidylinositol 3-phosphate 5-kinase-like isoform X2 n=1 Tax=Mya arenaria TaxID=6604 RepID=UPI0022E8688F|nr:1-phosphatidylinositol 3-phosphate 5-kinase-like isoform X2 [Mya arenaria]
MSSVWDDTPDRLTSFGPLSSDTQASGNFLQRLFKKTKDDSDLSNDSSKANSRDVSVERNLAGNMTGSREQSLSRNNSRDPLSRRDQSRDHSTERQGVGGQFDRKMVSPMISRQRSMSSIPTDGEPKVSRSEVKDEATRRTLGSVLTRLTAIVERRAPTPQVYRDSDFKQYWMPDSSCRECYECGDRFTTFRRRHHCRICGQIFCNACCCQELPGKIIGYKGSIRVCRYCLEIVSQYAQKADPDSGVTREVINKYMQAEASTSPDQKRSHVDLQRTLSLRSPIDPDNSSDSLAPFDLTPQTEFVVSDNFPSDRKLLLQDSIQLRSLWSLMLDPEKGLEFQTVRLRLRTNQRCVPGNRIVDWLLKQDRVANRVQAVVIGQALIDAAFLDPIHNITTPFRDDFTLYKPAEIPLFDGDIPEFSQSDETLMQDSAPLWFQQIQSNNSDSSSNNGKEELFSTLADLSHDSRGEIRVDERHFDEPQPQVPIIIADEDAPAVESIFGTVADGNSCLDTDGVIGNEMTGSFRTLEIDSGDPVVRGTYEKLQQEHHEHLTLLTKQLLHEENLPAGWEDIIISTVDRVTLFVKPDVKDNNDDSDIRKYVHIKKIPGDSREQTGVVHGVLFNKNVAHRRMAQKITDPSVLLLQGSIEYQRVENKMSYLEPQILQEEEFLKKSIKKITSLKPRPDILVVEKSVSRLAQEFLLKAGITLIYNVKESVMQRLSRFLDSEIATSIESLMGRIKVGFCHTFSVRSFMLPTGDTKNMICFDGCATHLGCAVILRGGGNNELKKVKRILNYMIYASYHSRLEIAFCMDEFLKPPQKEDLEFEEDISSKKKSQKETIETQSENKKKDAKHHHHSRGNSREYARSGLNSKESKKDIVNFYVGDSENISEPNQANVKQQLIKDNEELEKESVKSGERSKVTTDTENSEVTNATSKKVGDDLERTGSFVALTSVESREFDNIPGQGVLDQNVEESKNRSNSHVAKNEKTENYHIKNQTAEDNAINKTQGTRERSMTNEQKGKKHPKEKTDDLNPKDKDQEVNTNKSQTNQSISVPEVRHRNLSGNRRERSPNVQRRSAATQLTDHSDPLHNYQISKDESIFESSMAFQEQQVTRRAIFKKSLDNTVLSTSPYIKYSLPFLETESGAKCELRKYFPEELYWSSTLCDKSPPKAYTKKSDTSNTKVPCEMAHIEIQEAHEFIRQPLRESANNISIQTLMAKFRAYGGRINIMEPVKTVDSRTARNNKENKNKGKQLEVEVPKVDNSVPREHKVDCLDTVQHQKITVLFSSFSFQSENHPYPCVYPWVVTMEFYGRHDTTLGEFLERFCFRPSYVCPSDTCHMSMDLHIRRFVHGRGCLSLVLKRSTKEKPINIGKTIQMWSWCYKCKLTTPRIPMSIETWHLSFSRYLELRFHGDNFVRRGDTCPHSLHHENFQYFGYQDTVASFKYSAIKLKEIKAPPFVIDYTVTMETVYIYRQREEVKRLSRMVTEMFDQLLQYTCTLESEVHCEILTRMLGEGKTHQQADKTKIKELVLILREWLESLIQASVDVKVLTLDEKQQETFWRIEDGIVNLKRAIAETVGVWNQRLNELYAQQKKSKQSSVRKSQEPVSSSLGTSALGEPIQTEPVRNERLASELVNIVSNDNTEHKPAQTDATLTDTDLDVAVLPPVTDTDIDVTVLPPVPEDIGRETLDQDNKCQPPEPWPPNIPSSPDEQPDNDDLFSMSGGSYFNRPRQESAFSFISMSPPQRRDSACLSDFSASFMYGTTPGITAAGIWPESPDNELSETYVVCQREDIVISPPVLSVEESMKKMELEQAVNSGTPAVALTTNKTVTDQESEASIVSMTTSGPITVQDPGVPAISMVTNEQITDQESEASVVPLTTSEPITVQDPVVSAITMVTNEPITDQESEASVVSLTTSKPIPVQDPVVPANTMAINEPVTDQDSKEPVSAIATNEPIRRQDSEKTINLEASQGTVVQQKLCKPETLKPRKPLGEDQPDSISGAIRKTLQIGSIWPGSGAFQIPNPFNLYDHHLLPVCERVPVVVYDHEQSSIIAYSLSCHDYHTKLCDIQQTQRSSMSKADTESLDKYPREEQGNMNEGEHPAFTASMSEGGDKNRNGKQPVNDHIELQFSESTARFYCKVYFADQFRQLRKHIFPDGEDVYIRSLSRCKAWEASGGKSGSSFCKTEDDRFILKQMSGMEVESFEKFGPEYFQYLASIEKQQKPTAIAKIVGVYRIGFRNQQTNNAMKQDLLVMENLFYKRTISQTYDLKGSERNRLVKTARKPGKDEVVLLDENFLRGSVENPLYIRPHSKTVLMHAISHDSQFLASNLVMDYSLLVGLDEQKKELVVGIIDYIRTFTWDKKLETILKSHIGDRGKMPTVVSPEVYRTRFLDAMSKYFLPVPDQWSGLGKDWTPDHSYPGK